MNTLPTAPSSHHLRNRRAAWALAIAASLVLAACGGGGGGPSPLTPGGNPSGNPGGNPGGNPNGNPGGNSGPTNEGTYNLSEFNYTDPNPTSYHPFGDEVFCMDREELAVFTDIFAAGADGLVLDDAEHGTGDVAPIMSLWPAGTLAFDGAGGQLDDDFAKEMVAVGVYPVAGSQWGAHIRILGTDANGALVQESQFDAGVDIVSASLDLADVDGDGRDEIILACATGTRSSGSSQNSSTTGFVMRVYDDIVGGHALLFEYVNPSTTTPFFEFDCRAACGNFDGDDAAEIVLLERLGNEVLSAKVFDDASAGFATLHSITNEASSAFAPFAAFSPQGTYGHQWIDIDVISGNFDGDERDEWIVVGVDSYSGTSWKFGLYDDAVGQFAFVAEPPSNGWSNALIEPYRTWRSWQILSADFDGDGVDGAALVIGNGDGGSPSQYEVTVEYLIFGGSQPKWTGPVQDLQVAIGLDAYAFARGAVIRDALQPWDHLAIAVIDHGTASSLTVHRIGRQEVNVNNEQLYALADLGQVTRPLLPSGGFPRSTLVLAPADIQGDSIAVRYTGEKYLTLADPMPICVMAAPPTKSGISQNYDDSEVAYGRSVGGGTAHTVSTETTVTAEAGLNPEFFDGFFEAEVKAVYEQSIEQAYGSGTEIVRTLSYIGGHEEDHIVFQGTLYRSYKYEILTSSDPTLQGTHLSIDVPVSTRIYKWTLDYYNQNVEPRAQIDRSALLGHTIGDPASYLTRSEAESRAAGGRGWLSDVQTVGQGTRTNSASVEITTMNSTEQTRTIGVGIEAGLRIGPFTAGGSVGIGWSDIYTVETSVGTQFEGVVGDIEDPSEYSAWTYDFGLVLYHHGGGSSNERAYQVIHFWVEPTGTSY